MEQIKNPRSVYSQPIWLKSVRSEPDWLDLRNPWLKEVIWTDPEFIFSILYGELRPLSLLHTCGLSWKLYGLMCQLNQPLDWQVGSVEAHFSFRLALMDSPWTAVVYLLGICAPWAGSPIFGINKAQVTSSKLVRVGLRSCFHCNNNIFLFWIKNIWRLYRVVHVFVCIPSIMLLMW